MTHLVATSRMTGIVTRLPPVILALSREDDSNRDQRCQNNRATAAKEQQLKETDSKYCQPHAGLPTHLWPAAARPDVQVEA